MKYKVWITKIIHEYQEVIVDAVNENDATDRAIDIAEERGFSECDPDYDIDVKEINS